MSSPPPRAGAGVEAELTYCAINPAEGSAPFFLAGQRLHLIVLPICLAGNTLNLHEVEVTGIPAVKILCCLQNVDILLALPTLSLENFA